MNPLTPETQQPASPAKQISDTSDYTVTYTYTDIGKVQLSANNVILKVGQKLILVPALNLTTNTRFTSSGADYIGDFLNQESSDQNSGKVIFTAIKPGKGKLQVVPNTSEVDRAADLWVTVQ